MSNPEVSRVEFELPTRYVPEMLAQLGDFAAQYSFSIRIVNADRVTPDEEAVPQAAYNPRLVNLLEREEGSPIPIITEDSLIDLVSDLGWPKGLGTRTFNAIASSVWHDAAGGFNMRARPELMAYVVVSDDANGTMLGLRADRLPQLAHYFEMGGRRPNNFGDRGLELLGVAVERLHVTETQ